MKKVIFASFLTFLSLSSQASQQPLKTECSTCFGYEQFELKAKSKALVNKTRDVYVMNLETDTIEKFKVSKKITGYSTLPGTGGEPDGNGGHTPGRQIPIYSTEVSHYGVEQSVLNNFYTLSSAKRKLVESQKEIVAEEVPADIAGSVWDLVGSSSTQNKVAAHYSKYSDFNRDASNFATAAGKMSGLLEIDKVVMTVNFSDGSSAIYSLFGIINGKLVWDFERGTDVDLNKVEPNFDTTKAESYDFAKGGADVFLDFYNAAQRAGVSFYSTSGSGVSTGRVTCVTKGIGKYICTYVF
ncbi:hypothetical protein [Pseudoalteromonas sp. PB2-1]|uniref:hypothetical protein n=1 Tax=Pseudoalteromonas sp. PB2-1 TaxID=2907242 RepID=UPI003867D369